ncbi:MAG: hypothetical protein ACREOK_13610 [Gemmatimonadaceae bacterium]
MKRLTFTALVTVLCAAVAGGQSRAVVVDRGPGDSGRILSEVLAGPHRLVEPGQDTSWFVLPRDAQLPGSLVVLGRTTAVEGEVDRDVVVVGGDLFVRPEARVNGRAIAIGGGVYPSTLATIAGGVQAFRDNTFDIRRTDTIYELSYRSLYQDATPPLILPGIYGLREPNYDRVNGASIRFGPALAFAGGQGNANFIVTYRSDLGKFDPSAEATLELGRRSRLEAFAGRGTFSNDEWIWSDRVNSLSTLVFGRDTRNYYRGDRAQLTAHRALETATMAIEPFIGARGERSWAVGPTAGDTSSPWSIFERSDTLEGMLRPNPQVGELTIVSALVGTALQWESGGVRANGRVFAEQSLNTSGPAASGGNDDLFTQVTSELYVAFLTFGDQLYEIDARWMTTPVGPPPAQRFAYIGGSGTLPFLDLLEQGGDELLFLDQRYTVPLPKVQLGLLGSPSLQLRHRLGSAGFERLPSLEQALGVGLIVALIRGEFLIDPATGETRVSVGFSFAR